MRHLPLLALSLPLLSSCTAALVDHDAVGAGSAVDNAPLIGGDGAGDFADRSCQIVLRDLSRIVVDNGNAFAVDEDDRWIFEGRVDVQQTALAEGALPFLLVRAGDETTWRVLEPVASTGMPDDVERFLFHVEGGDLPGPADVSGVVDVIPYLGLDQSRLFDHNRVVDAFASYSLTSTNAFSVVEDLAICSDPAGPTIAFNADFTEVASGPIVGGRTVTIDYDMARLPDCRAGYAGRPAWSVFGVATFLPMNVRQQFVVSDHNVAPSASKRAVLDAPEGATELVVYFQNNDRAGCNVYDSDFGANYHFDVVDEQPEWLGNVAASISRGVSSRCAGAVAVAGPVNYDSWARQRAVVTDLCFEVYEPGVTDFDNADLWQQLDVQAHHRFASSTATAPFATSYVSFAHRVGNNAQYAVDLRALDPFAWGRCIDGLELTSTSVGGEGHVQATLEVYFTVNGSELRPAAGDVYRVVFDDYASSPRVNCE
ncbi:MAG TPA: DUF6209 family protein [Myxococcota bacterium]